MLLVEDLAPYHIGGCLSVLGYPQAIQVGLHRPAAKSTLTDVVVSTVAKGICLRED